MKQKAGFLRSVKLINLQPDGSERKKRERSYELSISRMSITTDPAVNKRIRKSLL